MKISIQKAKNGEDTATADGHFLHSNYAPSKEAQRFVENLKLPYAPKKIIILEPALSYAADFFKVRFPEIKLGVIRYEKDFALYNSKFDFVLNYFEHSDFSEYLEKVFAEEELLSTVFISWPPSAQIFSKTENEIWKAIKTAMERAKTLLITRQYFEKKWLINSCHFLKNIRNTVWFDGKIEKDVLIISSGPSLKPYINFICKNHDKFFIICLSSAISVCIKNNITPDLYMTTDGGFWAGEHLKKLLKNEIPVAMPAEAFCAKHLLQKLKVLPLIYGEGISKQLTQASGIHFKMAVRNGTVSGTALLFASQYFTKNIFMCGLDMASQKGFQHTQPNELETNSSIFDNRIKNKETRLARSELTNGSLDIYKNWFISNNLNLLNRNVFRLIEKSDRKNNLGWIKDIDLCELMNMIDKNCDESPDTKKSFFQQKPYHYDSNKLLSLFEQNNENENWQQQLFPLDYVSLSHNNNNNEIKEKIENEWSNLKTKISGILNENI